jgi:two-component system LytT family response regulator
LRLQRLRVLVVDDEPLAREKLRLLLEGEPDVEIAGESADGRSAVADILRLRPDVVFLDVQMPELDGFGVLEALEGPPPPGVVFVTAYDKHAVRAFEVHAIDYLLKPFDRARFSRALDAVRSRLSAGDGGATQRLLEALGDLRSGRDAPADRLVLKVDGRVVLLRAPDVEWIEAAGNHCCVHASGGPHVVRESLAAIEARLDPQRFVRVHRSAVVNLERVREVRPARSGDGSVLLESGAVVPLSRRHAERLLDRIES